MKEYYKVITCECTRSPLVQPLPHKSKPLCANIKSVNGECAVCASFYHPVQHAWIVHFVTLPQNYVEPVKVYLRVVVLLDADDRYEVNVVASNLIDGALPLEIEQLHRLSAILTRRKHASEVEQFASSFSTKEEKSSLRQNLVSLVAKLPSNSPWVLCGGGFYSVYPVLTSTPTHAGADDNKMNCFSESESFINNSSTNEKIITKEISRKKDFSCISKFTNGVDECNEQRDNGQCNAWKVTAPPHAELMCFLIALRRRSSEEWMQRRFDKEVHYSPAATSSALSDEPELYKVNCELQANTDKLLHHRIAARDRSTLEQYNIVKVNDVGDDDVADIITDGQSSKSHKGSLSINQQSFKKHWESQHEMLESMLLKQGICVSLHEKSCRWSISLPEPHKTFSVRWSPNLNASAKVINTFFK